MLRSRSTCKSRRRFDASLDSHWRTQDMRWRLEPRSTGRSLAAHAATAGCAVAAPSETAYRNYCYTPTVTILSQWQPKHNLVTQQLGAQQPLFPRHHPAILPAQDFSLRINPAAPGKRPTKGAGWFRLGSLECPIGPMTSPDVSRLESKHARFVDAAGCLLTRGQQPITVKDSTQRIG